MNMLSTSTLLNKSVLILFVGASPSSEHPVNVTEEMRTILGEIRKSRHKDEIDLKPDGINARITDLEPLMQVIKPAIFHFAGHFSKEKLQPIMQTDDNKGAEYPADAFASVFEHWGQDTRCIVLNACYSEALANTLSQYVDCVIGTSKGIEDREALTFCQGFYRCLGDGGTIGESIQNARDQLEAMSLRSQIIEVRTRTGVDVNKIVLLETRETELNNYLHHVMDQSGDDIEPVKHIEERDAVLLDVNTEWSSDDDDIRNNHEKEITDFTIQINRFLESPNPPNRILFIAAPFGVGKSVLVKKFASDLATKCQKNKDEYMPVFVPLRKGLNRVYSGSLANLLDNIIMYSKPDRKILLILNSLDGYEYENHGSLTELNCKITTEFAKYYKMKIILTSRLNIDPKTFEINGQKYLRLLSFTENQVIQFFKINNAELIYNDAIKYGIKHKELAKPLLSYMLLKVFPFINLKNIHQDFTSNMFRSFIYFHFLSHIAGGKQIEKGAEFKINRDYLDEKNAMRKLALLKQIHKDTLTKKKIEKEAKIFGYKSDTLPLSPILRCYPYSNSSSDEEEKAVDFIQPTFQEYLMAENYLEALLKGENKAAWMNVGKPSIETINFLDGLLQLLTSNDENIKKFVEYNDEKQISLFNLFTYDKPPLIDDGIHNIVKNAINNLNDESIMVFSPDHIEEIPWIKAEEQISVNEYPNLWIHRWISLYVLYKLGYLNKSTLQTLGLSDNKKLKSLLKFSRLLRFCSDGVLTNFKKLRGFNLSDANLSGADLSGADLCGANLSGADLSGTNLRDAILLAPDDNYRTNLSTSNLSNANLFRTNLSGADLSGARLLRADLSGADLSHAILIGANISDANISDANLSGANLSGADLYRANLSDARLIEATLIGAKLAYANLAYANLSGANLQGANLSYANLSDCNLNSAILSGANLQGANLSYANLYKTAFGNRERDLHDVQIVGANFTNKIITTIPADKDVNVSTSSPIMIFSNEGITLSDLTFRFKKEGCSEEIGGETSVSKDGKIVTFTPAHDLSLSTKYIVLVKCSSGNEKEWSFSTTPITTGKILPFSILKGSDHDGNVYENVYDNNLNTRWSNYDKGSYLIVDLGSIENIDAIDIAWFKGNRRQYSFEISVSVEGNDFRNGINDFPNIAYSGISEGKSLAPQRYKFKSEFKARYINIRVDGNTQNNWASISEVRLYGC
jgi:uncharacterized protein YjbI with pentapeptide repeats